MASAIACDLCETEQAVMMQTDLGNGNTISVGASCLMLFMGSAFAQMLSDADADVIAMYGQPLIDVANRITAVTLNSVTPVTQPDASAPHTERDTGPREDGGIGAPDAAEDSQAAAGAESVT